jgi:hypothetical protein
VLKAVRPKNLQRERRYPEAFQSVQVDSLEGDIAEQARLDIQVALRKRFPEKFKESDNSVPED